MHQAGLTAKLIRSIKERRMATARSARRRNQSMHTKTCEISTRQIASWSEPLIADYVFAAYERCFGGPCEAARILARQHCRVWRSLLRSELGGARASRAELLQSAARQRLAGAAIDAIDTGVFEQLLDIVVRRGQRWRDLAHSDGMALVHAASTLGEIREVA
jgi:hypothetical protein